MTGPGTHWGNEEAEAWGVAPGYHDVGGDWHQASPETVSAVLAAMGAVAGGPPPGRVATARLDRPFPDLGAGTVLIEGGEEIRLGGPGDPGARIPPGYHRLVRDDGGEMTLVMSPGSVALPGRTWGLAVQLYAARSRRSWGIGDFADLAALNSWSSSLGAGFTLVNPLHAPTPATRQQPSPYYPGSRCFMNPIYIAVEDVAGASEAAGLEPAVRAGRALNSERLIDRDQVWALKSAVLEEVFDRLGPHQPGLEDYRRRRGGALETYALYCVLAEEFGPDWRRWPADLQDSSGPGAAARGLRAPGRLAYHCWLQWLAETQAARAGERLGVMVDLAVGVDPCGPDTWIWSDCFAAGVRVGAPPDEFNTLGQDWGLAPYDPWGLRRAGYAPWVEALRANLSCGSALRLDHVMGLYRLFWLPPGADARAGAYVRYPSWEMLDILALEAHLAGAHVVGEDLGTVEDSVRADLADRGILSYRLWWFEERDPAEWPEQAMAAVTTHDLPTVAGTVSGSDLDAQRRIGMEPNEESTARIRRRLADLAGLPDGGPPGSGAAARAVDAVYGDLSHAPCLLLSATLEDLAVVEERPNMPGTVDTWPNWSLALPVPLEEIFESPLARRVAGSLGRGGTQLGSAG